MQLNGKADIDTWLTGGIDELQNRCQYNYCRGRGLDLIVGAAKITHDAEHRWLNFALLAFGASCGWLLGLLVSPYDEKEGGKFSKYGAALGAFVSGYLASKFDNLLGQILNLETLRQPEAAFRAISVVTACIVSLLVTYVYRKYAA